MPLVYIEANAPWGPVRLHGAANHAEMFDRVTGPPAHVQDIGDRDPAEVLREALRLLPPASDAAGFISTTVEKARNSVMEAVSRVSATWVAETPANPVSGKPESRGGAMASDGVAEPAFEERGVPFREVDHNIGTANDSAVERVRRRPGAEIDARDIRTKLGMSQPVFSRAYGIPLATLRDWEQGRRSPDGAGRSLLLIVERFPVRARKVLEEYGDAVGAV